jgi:molybdate transport system substrate-binding protein
MSADDHVWKKDWTIGLRLWVERQGHAILGKGRLELLEGIDRWHSISAAARQMGMSYRRAWLLVQSINEAAGEPLVAAAVGGTHGGGAQLTPHGRMALAVFRELQDQLRTAAAAIVARLAQDPAAAPRVHVAAAVSLEEVLGQLLADYALRQPTVSVRAVYGASDELVDHLLAGAPTDLILVADDRQLDRLETAGLLLPEARCPLAGNRLAAIAPAERALPIRKPADLVRAEVTHLVVAEPASPLGRFTRAYLESLGLYEPLRTRLVQVDNARSVVAALHAGQVDVGLVYDSDALTATGCQVLFRASRSQFLVRYTAALVRHVQPAEEARALLEFLTSREAARRFRRCGFVPLGDLES